MTSNIAHHLQLPNDANLPTTNPTTVFNDPSFDTLARAIPQSDNPGPIAHHATGFRLPRQRRRLEYVKCDFCRRSKKKVSAVQYHMHLIYPRRSLHLDVLSANPPSVNGQARNAKGVTRRDLPAPRLRRRIETFLMR